ncbi:MAG: hypothetical protein JW902_00115 [Syntrophaceae bacterium]|nr:hypothetical protein [Syntrophaceae bacterium]
MNNRICLIIFILAVGLLITGAIVGNILESSGKLTAASLGPRGITAVKISFFALFCIMVFSLIPLLLKAFVAMQIKIGNGDLFVIKWLQAHEAAVIYGFWSLLLIGLCIAVPAAIRQGFFK